MTKEEIITQVAIEKSKLRSMYPVDLYKVEAIVDAIIKCVANLVELTSDDAKKQGLYECELRSLIHTRDKEVNDLRYRYDAMRKPRAAQKREAEFDQHYANLLSRINRETILIE